MIVRNAETESNYTIEVDLNSVKAFNKLRLIPSSDGAERFAKSITLSIAGADKEYNEIGTFDISVTPENQTPVDFTFAEVNAQYLKLEIIHTDADYTDDWTYWYHESRIAELELYNIFEKGDVNSNDVVDILDFIRLKEHISEMISLEGTQLNAADINNDNKVDGDDLVLLKKKILGF